MNLVKRYSKEKRSFAMAENKEEVSEKGLQVFINGVPDLKLIPKEKWDSFITALELQISDYYNKKTK